LSIRQIIEKDFSFSHCKKMDPYEAEFGTEQHTTRYETLSKIEEEGKKFMQAVTAAEFRSAQNPKYAVSTIDEEAAVAQRTGILYPPFYVPQGDDYVPLSYL
jgi:hypothetical protein